MPMPATQRKRLWVDLAVGTAGAALVVTGSSVPVAEAQASHHNVTDSAKVVKEKRPPNT